MLSIITECCQCGQITKRTEFDRQYPRGQEPTQYWHSRCQSCECHQHKIIDVDEVF